MFNWLKAVLFSYCFFSLAAANIVLRSHFRLKCYNPNPVQHSEQIPQRKLWPWSSRSHLIEISSMKDLKSMQHVPYVPGPKPTYLSIHRSNNPYFIQQSLNSMRLGWYKLRINALAFTKMEHPPSKLAHIEVLLVCTADTSSVSFPLPLGIDIQAYSAMLQIRSQGKYEIRIQMGPTSDQTIVAGVTDVVLQSTHGKSNHLMSANLIKNGDFDQPQTPASVDYLAVELKQIPDWMVTTKGFVVKCSKYCELFKNKQAFLFTMEKNNSMLSQYFRPQGYGTVAISFQYMMTGLSMTGKVSVFVDEFFLMSLDCHYLRSGKVYYFEKTITLLQKDYELFFIATGFEMKMQGLMITAVSAVQVRFDKTSDQKTSVMLEVLMQRRRLKAQSMKDLLHSGTKVGGAGSGRHRSKSVGDTPNGGTVNSQDGHHRPSKQQPRR